MAKKVPHKHAAVIKAWADGATIQIKLRGYQEWKDWGHNLEAPTFSPAIEYRVKPEWQKERDKPEPVVQEWYVDAGQHLWMPSHLKHNLKLTFEDGHLVKAEVI